MAIFNSYVCLPEGKFVIWEGFLLHPLRSSIAGDSSQPSKLFKNPGHGSSILPNIQGTVYSPCVPWSATDSCACDPPVVGTQWSDLRGADMAVASDWTRHWRSSGSSQSVSNAHWGACAMAAMGRAVANVYQGLDFRYVNWRYPVLTVFIL